MLRAYRVIATLLGVIGLALVGSATRFLIVGEMRPAVLQYVAGGLLLAYVYVRFRYTLAQTAESPRPKVTIRDHTRGGRGAA